MNLSKNKKKYSKMKAILKVLIVFGLSFGLHAAFAATPSKPGAGDSFRTLSQDLQSWLMNSQIQTNELYSASEVLQNLPRNFSQDEAFVAPIKHVIHDVPGEEDHYQLGFSSIIYVHRSMDDVVAAFDLTSRWPYPSPFDSFTSEVKTQVLSPQVTRKSYSANLILKDVRLLCDGKTDIQILSTSRKRVINMMKNCHESAPSTNIWMPVDYHSFDVISVDQNTTAILLRNFTDQKSFRVKVGFFGMTPTSSMIFKGSYKYERGAIITLLSRLMIYEKSILNLGLE